MTQHSCLPLIMIFFCVCVCVCVCLCECLFRAAPSAYGSSQAKGRIRATAANVHHSSWQHQILNPKSEARDGTHILMDTIRVPYHRNSWYNILKTALSISLLFSERSREGFQVVHGPQRKDVGMLRDPPNCFSVYLASPVHLSANCPNFSSKCPRQLMHPHRCLSEPSF